MLPFFPDAKQISYMPEFSAGRLFLGACSALRRMFTYNPWKMKRVYKAEIVDCGTVGLLIGVQSIGMRSFLDVQLINNPRLLDSCPG